MTFEASLGAAAPADASVAWSVSEPGGGTVSAAGAYVAPLAAGVFHVVATSLADSTKSATATVTVLRTQACAAEPLRSTGTVHYFCDCQTGAAAGCVAGSDGNAGTSPSAPKQKLSTAAALFNSMPAGDTVALCNGGAFGGFYAGSATHSAFNANCTPSSTCDLRNYAAPWNTGSEGFPVVGPGSQYGITFDDIGGGRENGGYRVLNIDFDGASGFGIVFGHRVHDVDVCNVAIHNSAGGFTYGQSGESYNITVRQSSIHDVAGQGVLEACSNCVIDGNTFANVGGPRAGSSPQQHAIYLGSDGTGTPDGMKVTNNEIHAIAGAGGPVAFVVHGKVTHLLVESNVIYGAGDGYGLQIDQGGEGFPEGFDYAVVRRNQVFDAAGIGIQVDQCPHCLVEDNVVVMGGTGANTGIASGETSDCSGCSTNENVVYRNNTVFFPAGVAGTGLSLGGDGDTHVLTNNAVLKEGSGSFTCFRTPLPAASYEAVSNNACYGTSSWGTSLGTAAVSANPLFTDPGGDDFSFPSSSPLVNAGTASATCTVQGVASQPCFSPVAIGSFPWSATATAQPRTDGLPDIGAYEE